MPLTAEQREAAWKRFIDFMEDAGPATFTKPELRTALDEAIAWTEKNQVRNSFNSDLSGNFQSTATVQQKMVLLAFALLYEARVLI